MIPKHLLARTILIILSTCVTTLVMYWVWRTVILKQNVLGKYVSILKKEKFDFPNIGSFSHFYEFKPNKSIDDRPVWLHFTPNITINNDGLNERYDYPVLKPQDAFRIMTLGDSVTFGQYVDTISNFPELLENMLNTASCKDIRSFEVINLGVPGYDVAYTVEHYLRKGQKYQPNLIIWLINYHNLMYIQDLLLAREEEIEKTLTDEEKSNAQKEGVYYLAMHQAQKELLEKYGKTEMLHKQYQYLQQFSGNYKGPLLIVNFETIIDPDIKSLMASLVNERPNTWLYKELPRLDLATQRYPDHHPNSEGHKIIAKSIFNYLVSMPLFSCQ